MAIELGPAYLPIVPSFKGGRKAITAEFGGQGESIGRDLGGGARTGFGAVFKGVLASTAVVSTVKAIGGVVSGAFQGGFSRVMNIEQAESKLATLAKAAGLTGDAVTASVKASMASVGDAVDGTKFAISDAADMASQLGAAGVGAGKDMTRWLSLTADAAQFSGREFSDMQRTISKVVAEGRVTGETFQELPLAAAALAKSLGIPQAEVRKLASEGKISAAQFADAMEGMIGGAAKNAGDSFLSLRDNIKSALNASMAAFIKPVTDAMKPIMASGLDLVKGFRDGVAKPLGSSLADFLQPRAEALAASIGKIPAAFAGVKSILAKGDFTGGLGVDEDSPLVNVLFRLREAIVATTGLWVEAKSIFSDGDFLGGNGWAEDSPVIGALFRTRDALTEVKGGFRAFVEAWKAGDGDITSAGFPGFMEGLSNTFRTVFDGAKEGVSGFVQGFGGIDSVMSSLSGILPLVTGPLGILKSALMEMFGSGGISVDMQSLGKTVGSALKPILELAAELGKTLSGVLASALAELLPLLLTVGKDLLALAGDLAGQLVPVVMELASQVLPLVMKIIRDLAPVVTGLIAAFAPLISQLVAQLVPVFMDLVQTVLPPVMSIIDTLVAAIVPLVAALAPLIASIITLAVQAVTPLIGILGPLIGVLLEVVGMILAAVMPAITAFVQILSAVLTPIIQSLTPVISTVFGFIATTVQNVMGVVQGIIRTVTGLIKGDWGQVWSGIKQVFGSIWDQIKSIVSTAINLVKDTISGVVSTISGAWSRAWNGIKDAASAIWTSIKKVVSDHINAVKKVVSDVTGAISGVWDRAWGGIKDAGSKAWGWIKDTALGTFDSLRSGVESTFGKMRDALSTIWNAIKGVFARPINAVIGFINTGIVGGYNWVADKFGLKKMGSLSKIPGYHDGGWTGPGGKYQPAGIVHADEWVLTKDQVHQMGGPRGVESWLSHGLSVPGYASGGRVAYQGKSFTAAFVAAMENARALFGRGFHISQGGFRPRTSYSGTSHQGDAVDITSPVDNGLIAALRKSGIAAWDRTGKGAWAPHIHGVPLPGFGSAAGSAVWQAQDYLRGGDGLGGRDNGPRGGGIMEALKGLAEAIAAGFNSVKDWFSSIIDKVAGPFRDLTSAAGSGPLADLVSGVGVKLKDELTKWVKDKLGMGYATGTSSASPGVAWVGERGPELVAFRGGERVYPNGSIGGGVTITGPVTLQLPDWVRDIDGSGRFVGDWALAVHAS